MAQTALILALLLTVTTAQHIQLCHVIAGGELLRPGQEYKLGMLLCGSADVEFRVTIVNSGSVVAQSEATLPPGFHLVPVKVPHEITQGNCTIILEGKETTSVLAFKTTKLLRFSSNFLSLVIQTNRPIFTSSQTVRFRVLALDSKLRPYDDAMEVHIVDPDGYIMRRWVSIYTNNGIASLKFKLPNLAKEGYWKIRIKAKEQIEELKIKVENYFPPLFEVFVEVPPYILDTEEVIQAKVYGKFISEEIATGNVTIQAFISYRNSSTQSLLYDEKIFLKRKHYNFRMPMHLIKNPIGSEIKIVAAMTCYMSGETVEGFSKTRIIKSSIKIRFLNDQPTFFKPSMPFHTYVSVQHDDNVPVPEEILAESIVSLEITFHINSGDISIPFTFSPTVPVSELNSASYSLDSLLIDPSSETNFVESGVLGFTVIPPDEAEQITITAQYSDKSEAGAETKLVLHKYLSDTGKYLSIWTSTENAMVEEYAVLHVKTNFWISSFQYLVVSKGFVVNGGEIPVSGRSTSFPLALSPDMAPGFRVVVYVLESGKLLSDSIYLPLSAFNRYEMELTLNTGKDFRGDMVELIVSGDEAAYICAHSVRSIAYHIQAGNEMTESRVVESFNALENNSTRSSSKVVSRSRDGSIAWKTVYYQTPDYGKDTNTSFTFAGLFLVTHAIKNTSIV